jgi:hypothetical protein
MLFMGSTTEQAKGLREKDQFTPSHLRESGDRMEFLRVVARERCNSYVGLVFAVLL